MKLLAALFLLLASATTYASSPDELVVECSAPDFDGTLQVYRNRATKENRVAWNRMISFETLTVFANGDDGMLLRYLQDRVPLEIYIEPFNGMVSHVVGRIHLAGDPVFVVRALRCEYQFEQEYEIPSLPWSL